LPSLSQAFPVQVINPSVHKLVVEGGYRRRRWVDWAVFHVEPQLRTWTPEPEFRARWRRNAALKSALAREMRSASIAEPPSKLSQPGAFPSRGMWCRLIGPLINPIRQDNPSIVSPERQGGSPVSALELSATVQGTKPDIRGPRRRSCNERRAQRWRPKPSRHLQTRVRSADSVCTENLTAAPCLVSRVSRSAAIAARDRARSLSAKGRDEPR